MRHVPLSHAPPSPRTLAALTRRFAAGEVLSCEPLDHGLLNRGYRVATTRGSFFLKHHLGGDPHSLLPLAARHLATAALAARGLPVVPPLADPDGRTVALLDGRCYALHPWVEGHHREGAELSPAQCRRLGALLGHVHRLLEHVITGHDAYGCSPVAVPAGATGTGAGVWTRAPGAGAGTSPGPGAGAGPGAGGRAGPPVWPAWPSGPGGTARPADTLLLIDRLLARVRRQRRRTSFDELAEHRLRERRELLHRHAADCPDEASVAASGWVHGDFHPLNLLYRTAGPVEPVAILDWDRLGVRPRAEEAVRAAAIFFLRPDGGLELPKVRAYARAYRAAVGAGPDELAAAVHRVWWERLNDFWMLRWHYELRDPRTDPQFASASALVVWWTRHAPAVRDAFCD